MLKPAEAAKRLGVSNNTLINWAAEGKILFTTTAGGHRRYILPEASPTGEGRYVYARVSSSKQKDDLERQVEYLTKRFPNHEVIRDVGSGINFKRRGLQTILELLLSGYLKELVVAHRDRLYRFGFELFEQLFKLRGSVLTVLDNKGLADPAEDLSKDLLAIVTVFSDRYYGRRKYSGGPEDPNLRSRRSCLKSVVAPTVTSTTLLTIG